MSKLKTFHGYYIYRGANFFLEFCAKTYKEAAEIVGVTEYQIKTYYSIGMYKESTGIIAKPDGSRAVVEYGFGREKVLVASISELNEVINKKVDKYYNEKH